MPAEVQTKQSTSTLHRRFPIGVELVDGGAHARVWAPRRKRVELILDRTNSVTVLDQEDGGYFAGLINGARDGDLYHFKLDGDNTPYPDPASRFQPDGPHGSSQLIDPTSFKWTDQKWLGVAAARQVLYELHIGTFTKAGTWQAAEEELEHLAQLGVTCLEVMPVNEFAGRFGWGYDGVSQYAPFHHYGSPDDFRRFIDRAHALGIGIILDLVYNHLGPDGNYLPAFSDKYFNTEHRTDWGDALNYDGDSSGPVREYFVSNAIYWVTDFHLDGFRFDATQAIIDDSPEHLIAEISKKTRLAAGERSLYIINENEPQHTRIVRPIEQGGFGTDALWNDDFHHSAMVAASGKQEAYYTDHPGTPQEFISAAKWGYLFQGQRYSWQKKRRGTPALDLPPTAFVHFLQNHDQIANSGRGYRIHQMASPGQFKALTALLLLMPQTPMLFQGQEYGASNTFHYFADHNPDLGKLICAGRAKEISQFPSAASPEMQAALCDPTSEETFSVAKLNHSDREKAGHREIFQLHQDLLRIRRTDEAFKRVQRRGDIDGAVLAPNAFVLRYFTSNGDDRLLVVNLERDLPLGVAPEPLLAPPIGKRWVTELSTEDPAYGGSGTAPLDTEDEGWFIPGRAAVVLRPESAESATIRTRIKYAGSAQAPRRKSDNEGQP